jgi:hypothetical protein
MTLAPVQLGMPLVGMQPLLTLIVMQLLLTLVAMRPLPCFCYQANLNIGATSKQQSSNLAAQAYLFFMDFGRFP